MTSNPRGPPPNSGCNLPDNISQASNIDNRYASALATSSGRAAIAGNMDYRLGSHDSGIWQLAPDSLDRTQSSAYQLRLQLPAPSLCERVEKTTVPPSPREKRDLVDGRNESRDGLRIPASTTAQTAMPGLRATGPMQVEKRRGDQANQNGPNPKSSASLHHSPRQRQESRKQNRKRPVTLK